MAKGRAIRKAMTDDDSETEIKFLRSCMPDDAGG
ncbi:unnamed protein product [Phaeothamnion confervicola]